MKTAGSPDGNVPILWNMRRFGAQNLLISMTTIDRMKDQKDRTHQDSNQLLDAMKQKLDVLELCCYEANSTNNG